MIGFLKNLSNFLILKFFLIQLLANFENSKSQTFVEEIVYFAKKIATLKIISLPKIYISWSTFFAEKQKF